jgi:hypothetical protein
MITNKKQFTHTSNSVNRYSTVSVYIHTYIHTYIQTYKHTNIHTYHSRFIPERVAEASQIFLRDAHVLPKLLSYKEYCRRDRW